mmetsp:Transcript_144828/g.464204  ORF Transcript_144828/g.464204 Transcript_144828/m.464204 type:complete len:205 (+) Transcript_144828:842-1456(+)
MMLQLTAPTQRSWIPAQLLRSRLPALLLRLVPLHPPLRQLHSLLRLLWRQLQKLMQKGRLCVATPAVEVAPSNDWPCPVPSGNDSPARPRFARETRRPSSAAVPPALPPCTAVPMPHETAPWPPRRRPSAAPRVRGRPEPHAASATPAPQRPPPPPRPSQPPPPPRRPQQRIPLEEPPLLLPGWPRGPTPPGDCPSPRPRSPPL